MDISRILFLLITLVFSLFGYSSISIAKEVLITTSQIPYRINQQLSHGGIDKDIVTAAFDSVKLSVAFSFTSMAKSALSVTSKQSDASMPVFEGFNHDNMCLSKPYIAYELVALSLKKRHIKILHPADLKAYRIVSFEGASTTYPESIKNSLRQAKSYYQHSDMNKLLPLLAKGYADIIILDRIAYKAQLHKAPELQANSLQEHPVFTPVLAYLAFSDNSLCNKFNRGLDLIKKSGLYDNIVQTYEQGFSMLLRKSNPEKTLFSTSSLSITKKPDLYISQSGS